MAYQSEEIIPYRQSGDSKKEQVEQMFDAIAGDYDRLNTMMSLSFDKRWRKNAIRHLNVFRPQLILDIATGTGDFAIQAQRLLHPSKIVAVDISDEMMAVGKIKVKELFLDQIIDFQHQDCAEMTFPDKEFDAATAAFGVRNFEDLDKSFREIWRVLKDGGVFAFLELSVPRRFPMRQLYGFHSRFVIPALGKLFSKDQRAYQYLPESIRAFPQGEAMIAILKKNGFKNVRHKTYTGGVCTLYIAEK
ncbi:MAG: bifunctional demethylmenaquinone methyltransferase/2-methoxy-6-polyprenyl-1,4-benzoquinol methylase UbiE [Dysgonamonadaceae bacterium]|jgi:demethylmenaquinone methyltransferase/2-methoxy-6-polyprenyl-1,4-benzoquinol methylase|nr:bifunctional demethylmenaquinone methyltransferase/2-methoxy-6-polyprenyl-1,4-benzoquinol methylase UbiE [Dysgonamonadaceae bacterium]